MPRYGFGCATHGEHEHTFAIGEAPSNVACPSCRTPSPRIFSVPHFTEDRRRFGGEGISAATGVMRAQSRQEERVIEKTMGIEFMGKNDTPPHIRNAAAYGAHIKSGGDKLPNDVVAELVSPPREKPKSIVELLREKAPRLGEIPTDRLISGKKLPPFPKDVAI